MRLTNSMLINNMMSNLGKNAYRINNLHSQLQTGKKFTKPSEDPVGSSYAMQYRTDIAKEEQYLKNVEDANEVLTATETALMSYNNVLTKARELAVQGTGAALSAEARNGITVELRELKAEAIKIANTAYNGRYLFSGYKTDQKLIDEKTGKYIIDVENLTGEFEDPLDPMNTITKKAETISYEIGYGSKMQVNTLGPNVFGSQEVGETPEVIAVLDKLIYSVATGDTNTASDCIGEIDSLQDVALASVTEIGGRVNRLELTKSRLENSIANLENNKSLNEDIDLAEATTKLAMEQTVYQASLASGARIIQPTLLDFLR